MKRPDNSSELPGKKDHVRGETRFALCDSLRNLHHKFVRENPGIKVAISTFCKARRSNIRLARYAQRQICLCKDHANFALMLDAIRLLPKSTSAALELSDSDIIATIFKMDNTTVRYHQWESTKLEQNGKLVTKVSLIDKTSTKDEFAQKIKDVLPAFRMHCHRITVQYDEIHFMKDNLTPLTDISVQLDYSENLAATYL